MPPTLSQRIPRVSDHKHPIPTPARAISGRALGKSRNTQRHERARRGGGLIGGGWCGKYRSEEGEGVSGLKGGSVTMCRVTRALRGAGRCRWEAACPGGNEEMVGCERLERGKRWRGGEGRVGNKGGDIGGRDSESRRRWNRGRTGGRWGGRSGKTSGVEGTQNRRKEEGEV
ncbi:uncharacterized protein BDZ99DRAFT_471243 [Mytilinidion resinicola]|uniref:Uncharacterized protein n=1 Tax=Mytilinidion resinicola TaxID=574789 RepID=A0A6A6Z5C8_9PEZI|nr:uncharacterized protein BDZ99DRAFT_471243 [Mytilinidion resinicola]KAF2815939.1 hypothetical protein BDZ99DRAFT_471243 [Mytilinidion resinicola]